MNRVVEILMTRDGMTKEDAIVLIDETREMMIAEPWKAEDIMLEMLGLEIDYIMQLF